MVNPGDQGKLKGITGGPQQACQSDKQAGERLEDQESCQINPNDAVDLANSGFHGRPRAMD
jgi:hypothetical protein